MKQKQRQAMIDVMILSTVANIAESLSLKEIEIAADDQVDKVIHNLSFQQKTLPIL